MLAIGNLADAAIGVGGSTIVSGLVLSPTSPATLSVEVGPGSIYTREEIDSVAYGSLGTNTTQFVIKQGINLGYTTFTLTPPVTSGYTQLYLIQAQLQETDIDPVALNYYNSTPPYTPFVGPGGSGTPQNTVRTCVVALQLISSGTPYPTGTDPSATSGAVPGVTSGWVGLYLIPVNNGQTQITTVTGLNYPGSPFLPQKLSVQRLKLTGSVTVPVSVTGSDSWVQPTPFTPFHTLQHAVNYLSNSLDFNGRGGTITLGAGTFAGAEILGTFLGQQGPITIQGAGSSNTTLTALNSYCINAQAGAEIALSAMTIDAVTDQYGISSNGGAIVNVGSDVKFAGSGGAIAHIAAGAAGQVNAPSGYSVSAGGTAHIQAYPNANINLDGSIAFSGTPAFSVATLLVNFGYLNINGVTWSGSATGMKYLVALNGVLDNGGGGGSGVPGSSDGGTLTGGQVN